jgi:hypothetical protein
LQKEIHLRIIKTAFIFALLLSLNTFADEKYNKHEFRALPGTNTIVISISIDQDGYPIPSLMDEMTLHPGQKIVFAGPDEFTIFFKDGKSPFKKHEFKSKDGVVIIQIPERIFEDNRFFEENYQRGNISFNYGVNVNGKVTDPSIHVEPR